MKKIKNFICFILILTSLVTFIPTASYAMGDATGEFRVIGCEYTRKKSGYTIHLVIKTINYDKQNFTATFFVDGNTSYSEEISGTIQKDRVWASSSDYEYNISFKVNWKNGGNYNLDISDDAGILYGFCDNEGILGLDCKFVGAAGAIGKSEKIARMKYSNELYTETRDLSVAVYSDSKTVAASSKSVDAENYENATDNTFIFGVCYGNNSDSEKTFNYSIGAICDENIIVPKGFRKNTIPARTWAIFECKGAMPKAIQDMWHKITAEFFPISGYQPTCEMDIEAYTEGDMGSENYRSEIWIPVVKK